MDLTVERITPKKAREILEGNTANRNLRPRVVDLYARDMEQGNWTDAGDPIRINCEDNLLLDGQHRLHAVIKSGKPQKMVVARGVPKITMLNIDTGVKRTFADNLKLLGHKYHMQLATVIRWCTLYESDDRAPFGYAASHAEMMEWFINNPRIEDHVQYVGSMEYDRMRGVRTILIVLRHYCSGADFEFFLERLISGAGLEEGSPILALRRFIDNAQLVDHRKPVKVYHAVTILAWNAFIQGEDLSVLRFRMGGARPDAFPEIVTEA